SHRSTDIGWRRSRKAASRSEGRAPSVAFQARESAARSLSEKESAIISAGCMARSTGSIRSSREAEDVARMCIVSGRQKPLHGRPVEPLQADHDEPCRLFFSGFPGAVVVVRDARTHRLYQQAHRLALDVGETLQAQDVFRLGRA